MKHEQVYPRCRVCGKASYATWTEAQHALDNMHMQRKAARGFRVYRSRACQAIHVGRATDNTRRRHQRTARKKTPQDCEVAARAEKGDAHDNWDIER